MTKIRQEEVKPENVKCENCGLPSYATDSPGYSFQIEIKPEGRFQKLHKRTVWCHERECAVQVLGMGKYGKATFRWPVTLNQFRGMAKKLISD